MCDLLCTCEEPVSAWCIWNWSIISFFLVASVCLEFMLSSDITGAMAAGTLSSWSWSIKCV